MRKALSNSIRRNKLYAYGLVVVLLFLTSCAHKLDDAFVAPSYSYSSLKSGGLIYAGLFPGSSELDEFDQERLSEIGYKVLKKIRDDLPIYDNKWLKEEISSDSYNSLITDFNGMPFGDPRLALIEEKYPHIQYIMITEILRNEYSEDHREEFEFDEQEYDLHRYRSRKMVIQVEIYDLKNSQIVWSGIAGSTETEKEDDDLGFGERIVMGIVGGIIGGIASSIVEGTTGYPMSFDKLSQENLVISCFVKIAHSLSDSEKKKKA